jgi:DNA adenine methylase
MILSRIGNKRAIAKKVAAHFPPHNIYIEPFFGAGGMFFNKPASAYNILNDLDNDVYNLFNVVMNRKAEFVDMLTKMPIHQSLFNHWVKNKEEDPVKAAVRFIFLSNFSYLGKADTLKLGFDNSKKQILNKIDSVFSVMQNAKFTNCDFREVFQKISFRPGNKENAFIYADPPYLGTTSNYSNSFKKSDVIDLFDCLINSGTRFAYSEFDNPFIIEQANERGLNIEYVCERNTIKNKNIEILITNYKNDNLLF